MHLLLGVSETYLRVRSHAPLSCYDGASAYRYVAGPKPPEAEHRLHVTLQYVLGLDRHSERCLSEMNFAKRRRSVAETTWLFVLRNSQKTGLHESSPSPLFLSIKFLTTGHPPRPLSTATQRRCTKVLYRWIGTLSGCGPPEISDCRVQPRSGRSLGDIVSVLSRVGRRSRAPLSCVLFARSRSITSRPCVSVPSLW